MPPPTELLPPAHPACVRAGLIEELRQLPSKQALQLRSDAANIAASVGDQSKALDKALCRVAKQYGI